MNERTKRLTTGAMFTAIFAMILLFNRQSGGMFEEIVMFLLPIPMVGFSSKYGGKAGIPVAVAMSLISIIVSTPTAIFYAVTESIIGLVLGAYVYGKKDMTKAMLIVMGLSAVANVLNMVVLASLFGYNLSADISEMQSMMIAAFEKANAPAEAIERLQLIITAKFMFQMFVVSMALMGLIQGLVVYQLSLMILRRLKFYVPKPKSLYLFYPPMWSGIAAAIFYLAYNYTFNMEITEPAKSIVQMIGIVGYVYLMCFGFVGMTLLCKKFVSKNIVVGVIIATIVVLIFPFVEMMIGICYMVPSYHANMLEGLNIN